MSREAYDFLTDATRDGLTDNVKAAASGWDKCTSYVYAILSGEKKDPFAPFRSLYIGLCKGGVSTAEWDNDLAGIRQKYTRDHNSLRPTDAFQRVVDGNHRLLQQFLKGIEDGQLDLNETNDLLRIIAIEKPLIGSLEMSLLAHRTKLEQGQ